jgi:hypothetical protein
MFIIDFIFDALIHGTAALFRMDERAWERHANPWSVWTRMAAFPALMLALWSAHWIGWYAALPIAAMTIFLWLNPRLFPPPASTRSWASRAVLGERVYFLRTLHPVPVEHSNAATLLGIGAAVGALFMVAGLLTREPLTFLAGGAAAFVFKLWFVDRMVWLYDEMSERVEEYRKWLR